MYKIAPLILTPSHKIESTNDIFIAQPDANKEELVGKLFILAEIKGKRSTGIKLINFLVNNISNNYYQNEKIVLIEKISSLKPEHIFESALAKSNKHLQEFIYQEKIKLHSLSLNITIGIVYGDQLYFTNLGKNKALLIYPDKTNQQSQSPVYKLADITEKTSDQGDFKDGKLFHSVVSGTIPQKGFFLLTNETLPEYLTANQLIDIISTLPPASAIQQINNLLTKINALVPFLAILIKNVSRYEDVGLIKEKIPVSARSSTQDSISGLNVTEEQTERLLTPSGIINIKKIATLFKSSKRIIGRQKLKSTQKLLLKDRVLIHKKLNIFFLKKIYISIKNFFIHFINFIFYLLKILTNKEKFILSLGQAKNKIIIILRFSVLAYQKLGKKSKIFIIIFITSIALLVQNMVLLNYKNNEIEKQENYDDIVELIEQKQNQADANLLYSNDEGAKKLFEEIESLITGLPKETNEEITKAELLQAKLNEQLEKLRNVTRVDAREIADLSNLVQSALPENIAFNQDNNKLYIGDTNQKIIYIVELDDMLVTSLAEFGETIESFRYPIGDNENNIYYFNKTNILMLNTETEEMEVINIGLPADASDIVDADIYNARYYTLVPANNQIYRHNRAAASFGIGQPWLSEELNLTNAISISIDGNIYLLNENGEILKLLSGALLEFKLEGIDPPLDNCTKLFVSPEGQYLYILEPAKQRLVIFDKNGQFITQYTSAQFDSLIDFAIDEKNQQIFVINGHKVYAFIGTHFEN